MYVYIYICIERERNVYVCVYIYIYIYAYIHTHMHVYIYIYIYIYTHVCTRVTHIPYITLHYIALLWPINYVDLGRVESGRHTMQLHVL